MKDLNVSIIGAGSVYTPELIEGLANNKEKIPVKNITLFDIDEERLEIMKEFCKRYVEHLGLDATVTSTTDRKEAIVNADFINTQIRVGGNKARVQDEKIPLKYGIIGQETTGPGGFMKGLRTIPVLIDIARDVEKYNPDAWIINYANPAGLVTEAVNKYTNAKIVGLCAGGMRPQQRVSKALGVDRNKVKYDLVGLNHMHFAYNIKIDGRPLTDEEFDKVSETVEMVSPDMIRELRMIPSSYTMYYYHTSKKLKELKEAPLTRGEQVLALQDDIFKAYADPNVCTKPELLKKRGGGGYSEIAIGTMRAIHNDENAWIVVNVPNNGTIPMLPDDAVIETPCLIDKTGIKPLNVGKLPSAVWGMIAAVKNYEQLAVEAAVHGDRNQALLALMAHPLVRDYDIAKPMLDELLEANKEYLPQFFK